MAYLGTEKLKTLIKEEKIFGDDSDLTKVKSGAYELSLGDEVFRTDAKDKKKEYLKKDKELVTINPGQFALLLTHESVNIPLDKIAFISIKAKIKLKGLINVSGFHVDPGFKGNLVFSVYNAGTSPISLERGESCFLIWFAELTNKEASTYNGEHKDQNSIPSRYIDALIAGELASPNVLLEKINDNYKTLDGKATTRDYIYRTGIGVIIVIALKLLVEWGMYSKGYDDGYKRKANESKADSSLNEILSQQRKLLIEIDSLKKIKTEILNVQPNQKSDGKH